MWVVLFNKRGQLDLRRQTFGSRSSSGKQRMDKEKLVLSVLVSHGQNNEAQIEDEGCLEWKRKKGLDGTYQRQEMQGLGCSCVQQIPEAYISFFNINIVSILTSNLYSVGTDFKSFTKDNKKFLSSSSAKAVLCSRLWVRIRHIF
jgi:hypothetical protein